MNGVFPRSRNALSAAGPLLAVLCIVLAYDAPLLTMRGLALDSDGVLQYYPAEHALAGALAGGSLPFWAPEIQAGYPLLAQGQPGPLYPLNLLAFGLLPTPVAHNAIIVLHHVLGVLCMCWWGRTLGLSPLAAAGIALIAGLTPPLHGSDVQLLETMTWVPLLFALAERCARRGARHAWWAAPVAGVQWLAGFPQIALYTTLTSHIYLAVRVCVEPLSTPARLRRVAAWCGAAVIGVLLAAPQLLSTYELSGFSIRSGGIHGSLAGERSLFPPALLTLVLPSWRTFFAQAGLGAPAYFGLLPCILALVALIRGRQTRWFSALTGVIVVTTILACGHYSPLFPLIRALPGFTYFRVPSRFLMITQFGLITLCGLGWDSAVAAACARRSHDLPRLLRIAAAVSVLNGVILYPVVRGLRPQLIAFAEGFAQRHILTDPYHVQPPAYYAAKVNALYASLRDAVSPANPSAWIPLAVAVAGWLAWWWCTDARRHAWRQVLLGALIALELLAFAGGWHATVDPSWVTNDPPTARFLKRFSDLKSCRLFWVVDARAVAFNPDNLNLLQANYNMLTGLRSTGIYASLGFHAYYRLMQPLGTVDLGFGYRPVGADDVARQRALLDLLNVCYVLSRAPLTGFTQLAQVRDVSVYRNDQAMPPAFAVGQVEIVASADAALAWVEEHPERLRDAAVLEEQPPMTFDAAAARAARVSVTQQSATAVTIDVAAPGSVLLVLTDTYYPGWRARLDGRATPIYRTHGVFRAVAVPAGVHQVRFEYASAAFRNGAAIAGVAGLLWVAWGVRLLRMLTVRA